MWSENWIQKQSSKVCEVTELKPACGNHVIRTEALFETCKSLHECCKENPDCV